MKSFFIDRVHRLPRVWSNRELRRVAHLFGGHVVNVSAWRDEDKEGNFYRDYFVNATQYSLTNYTAEANGLQNVDNEIFLDLEKKLSQELRAKFDVVFNHTTLEHIFEVETAFQNLCEMSNDVVITVVPFLQQYHAHYGDYWRFSPELMKRLFEKNGLSLVYQSFNSDRGASVYLFSIATRKRHKWLADFSDWEFTCKDPIAILQEPFVGCHAIPNRRYRLWLSLKMFAIRLVKRFR